LVQINYVLSQTAEDVLFSFTKWERISELRPCSYFIDARILALYTS